MKLYLHTLVSLLILSSSPLYCNIDFAAQVTEKELKEFALLYAKRPVKLNGGGMKSVGMFWVWFVVKTIQPDLIVESGIYKGQSTWLLEQAAPHAKIISIDPSLYMREYISDRVTYHSKDFSTLKFGNLQNMKTLCFFDDHQNALQRIIQAHQFGFKHILFDDNYPVGHGSHLTLAHCLADNALAHQLEGLIEYYTVLPQIYGTSTKTMDGLYEVQHLNISCDTPLLNIYKQEALSYRWTTYVTLKD